MSWALAAAIIGWFCALGLYALLWGVVGRARGHRLEVEQLNTWVDALREEKRDLHSRLMARSEMEYATSRPYVEMDRPREPEKGAGTFIRDDTGLIDGWVDETDD